ncbi:hypothetical protein FACS1894152_3130 [Bacilli bacterium]|nr:hypothetical protein FACS1894152_3130 [Bacilli bacterium]
MTIKRFKSLFILVLVLGAGFIPNNVNAIEPLITGKEKNEKRQKDMTLGIIKPDAVRDKKTGSIIKEIEDNGFEIVAQKQIILSESQVRLFYGEHINKPFFGELMDFMTSGPIVVLVLVKKNAVGDYRKLMGATNPLKAEKGTLRSKYGADLTHNAVHGSDSLDSARREIYFFFSGIEMNVMSH